MSQAIRVVSTGQACGCVTSLGDDVVNWCISLDDVYVVETLSGRIRVV
jgi:hypothetical protein